MPLRCAPFCVPCVLLLPSQYAGNQPLALPYSHPIGFRRGNAFSLAPIGGEGWGEGEFPFLFLVFVPSEFRLASSRLGCSSSFCGPANTRETNHLRFPTHIGLASDAATPSPSLPLGERVGVRGNFRFLFLVFVPSVAFLPCVFPRLRDLRCTRSLRGRACTPPLCSGPDIPCRGVCAPFCVPCVPSRPFLPFLWSYMVIYLWLTHIYALQNVKELAPLTHACMRRRWRALLSPTRGPVLTHADLIARSAPNARQFRTIIISVKKFSAKKLQFVYDRRTP